MPVVLNREPGVDFLDIGLVNNMPGKALETTERQFLALLGEAAGPVAVRVSLYSLTGVSRRYSNIDEIWNRSLDGIIVTGTEPRAADLKHEPYWPSLARLIHWAQHHTRSAMWSCLAAHAAVLHLDGIPRRRLRTKRSGIFQFDRVSENFLASAIPSRFEMPHSRWHDLPEKELDAAGYTVLSRSKTAGVDAFMKQGRSLFLFFQGHPEYEPNTLSLEYLRDVRRYLRCESATYPAIPRRYFDRRTTVALSALEAQAASHRGEALLAEFPSLASAIDPRRAWHAPAVSIYSTWLRHLRASKIPPLPVERDAPIHPEQFPSRAF
jgi:homoserine O-succinyltransferase/O-acetyltransferase